MTIDVDRGMIEGVRESTSTRTRTVGEEETADYAESDEDEDGRRGLRVAMGGRMCLPTFVDIHTHIDKAHTCERSRNLNGTLAGADAACANDFQHWTLEDAKRRMGFAIQCAYAYGTSAMRTHLMSGEERQSKIAWEAFGKLREEWRGKVELQGVSLSVLSFFRDETKARALARMVKSYGGILGAAVSCSDAGGTPLDVHTTCGADMPKLLDVIFSLAKEYNLDVDFHCDENGNESSKGLLHIWDLPDLCKILGLIIRISSNSFLILVGDITLKPIKSLKELSLSIIGPLISKITIALLDFSLPFIKLNPALFWLFV